MKKIIKIKWFFVSVKDMLRWILIWNLKLKKSKKELLLIWGHDASSNGGASVVLANLVENLDLNRYVVIVFNKTGGNLRDVGDYNFVYQYFPKIFLKIINTDRVRGVLINTVVCGRVVEITQQSLKVPIIWWLHESNELFHHFQKSLPRQLATNVKVVCVSKKTEQTFKQYYPEYKSVVIHYGIRDCLSTRTVKTITDKKIEILVIGMLTDRKNQLQILEMLKYIPEYVKSKIVIKIIAGTYDPGYRQKFIEQSQNIPQIMILNGVEHEKLIEMYRQATLLICCSKEDPLPVVVSESLMMGCPCIVSSGCGQYSKIKDGVNGYRYNVEDTRELAEKLLIAIRAGNLDEIACKGRDLYLSNYSEKKMIEQFKHILNL